MVNFSDALGAESPPIEVTAGGKAYKVGPVTQKVKAAVERRLQKAARETVFEDRGDMTEAEFGAAYGAFLDRKTRGEYQFGGPLCRDFLKSPAGFACLASLLTGAAEAEVERVLFSADGKPLVSAVTESIAASFPAAAGPKAAAGAATTAPASESSAS